MRTESPDTRRLNDASLVWLHLELKGTGAIKLKGTGQLRGLPTTEAEARWTKTCQDIANMTLFPKAESWIFGANIPGKPHTVYFYLAGLGAYRQELSAVQNKGYEGFVFQ